jgi:hypothetical protein
MPPRYIRLQLSDDQRAPLEAFVTKHLNAYRRVTA